MSATDFIFVVVSREDVFAGDIDDTLAVLHHLVGTPEALTTYRERVEIQFDGFNETPLELWEIPEVRSFVDELDEQFPYWLYFLTREGTRLQAIARCFLLPHLTEAADARINGPKLADLLTRRWFPALNHIAGQAGLSEEEVMEMSGSALEYFVHGRARGGQR